MKTLQDLGIPYSKTKTMKSKTTYEFAKRWIHLDVEISPFPLNSLHSAKQSIPMIAESFRNASEKGWFSNEN